MSNYNNDKKILRILALNVVALILFAVMAVLVAQIGDFVEVQTVYATEESDAPQTTVTEEIPDSSAPEETLTPTATAENLESPSDSNQDETTAPTESSAVPESEETTETPVDTSVATEDSIQTTAPAEPTLEETPGSTETKLPAVSQSGIPTLSKSPATVTPSPTLADIEEPIISGNVAIDVEQETYIPDEDNSDLIVPDDLLDSEATSSNDANADDVSGNGFFAVLLDILMYFFIGCAVVAAGFSVYIVVKIIKNKKNVNKK